MHGSSYLDYAEEHVREHLRGVGRLLFVPYARPSGVSHAAYTELARGASAGSNVAGMSIGTTNDMPIAHPPSLDALALVPFNINPHYIDPDPESKHVGETRETRIKEFHVFNNPAVIGLREGAVLRLRQGELTLEGCGGARLFRRDRRPTEHLAGAVLNDLLAPARS